MYDLGLGVQLQLVHAICSPSVVYWWSGWESNPLGQGVEASQGTVPCPNPETLEATLPQGFSLWDNYKQLTCFCQGVYEVSFRKSLDSKL